MIRNIHPTSTGGTAHNFLKQRSIGSPDEPLESNFIRCYQCGFINDVTKIEVGDSQDETGKLLISTTVNIPTGTRTVIETDESVFHGCRFCKSKNVDGRNIFRRGFKITPRGYRG